MELASMIDLFPTIANLVGATMPDVVIDGIDMAPILFKNSKVCIVLGFFFGGGLTMKFNVLEIVTKEVFKFLCFILNSSVDNLHITR